MVVTVADTELGNGKDVPAGAESEGENEVESIVRGLPKNQPASL